MLSFIFYIRLFLTFSIYGFIILISIEINEWHKSNNSEHFKQELTGHLPSFIFMFVLHFFTEVEHIIEYIYTPYFSF